MRYPNGRILVFAKTPVPGYAKTRLIPALGEQGAADLQGRMIRRTINLAMDSGLAPVEVWICGDSGQEFFDPYRSTVGGRIHLQTGPDLGARMGHALEQSLQDAEFAVLIGTDCPVLEIAHLEAACASLAAGSDAVLGPAEDGGYVLIGLGRFNAVIFDGIRWGTSDVLRQTRERISGLEWTCRELPVLWDVDQPEDLERLAASCAELTSTTS